MAAERDEAWDAVPYAAGLSGGGPPHAAFGSACLAAAAAKRSDLRMGHVAARVVSVHLELCAARTAHGRLLTDGKDSINAQPHHTHKRAMRQPERGQSVSKVSAWRLKPAATTAKLARESTLSSQLIPIRAGGDVRPRTYAAPAGPGPPSSGLVARVHTEHRASPGDQERCLADAQHDITFLSAALTRRLVSLTLRWAACGLTCYRRQGPSIVNAWRTGSLKGLARRACSVGLR